MKSNHLKNFLLRICCAIVLYNWLQRVDAAELEKSNKPTKVAFLVGVSEYEKAGLRNLKYAEADATDFAKELKSAGFTVHILTGSASGADRATRENIRTALEQKYVNELKKLKKSDISLVCLSGHGMQFNVTKNGVIVEDAFYCPVDALKSDPASMLSVSDLMENIAANSGAENNLFVIDACRDNPAKGGKGIDGSRISLPGNVAVLFGASSGTQSYESEELKHGLLTYYLLEGIRGKVKDDEGDVTWDALAGYAKKQVAINARKLIGEEQTPISPSGIKGAPPVLARISISTTIANKPIPPNPSTPRPDLLKAPFYEAQAKLAQIEWAKYLGYEGVTKKNSIGMHFTLIPPGEFTMGNDEPVDAIMKRFANVPEPAKVRSVVLDAENQHKAKIMRPFFMGTYEVTNAQFAQFVNDTNYKTTAERDSRGGNGLNSNSKFINDPSFNWRNTSIVQTDDRPVVNVSWADAKEFCKWLSKKEGLTYRLPTEEEWEYSCRAGTTTFYWNGNDPEKLIQIANIWDAGTKESPHLSSMLHGSDGHTTTAPVGQYKPNPFGLYDMIGNVSELCNDIGYENYNPQITKGMAPVTRGGSWFSSPVACRSAYRTRQNYTVYIELGFRVCLVTE